MNVLLVSSPPSTRGGIANWVRLMHAYIDNGSAPGIVLKQMNTRTYKGLHHGVRERFVLNGIDLLGINRTLGQMTKDFHPDVIHITVTGEWAVIRDALVMRWAKRRGIPCVCHIRFGRLPEFRETNGYRWKMLRYSLSMASAIWAIDCRTEAELKNAFPEKRICYIPNPVAMSDMPKHLPEKTKTICFVGWVVKTKGVEELLGAWQKLRQSLSGYCLRIVGRYEEEYLKELKQRYDMDGVEFMGGMSHADTLQMVASSEIFVLPSYTEGFPNAVVEAMMLKTPIIASDVGAIGDMLSGGCGAVIEPKNEQMLEQAMDSLMKDSAQRYAMAQRAYEKALEEYSVENVVHEYEQEWSEVIQQTSREE